MNIVFVEPAFPANQRQFVRGLAEVGATVIGVGERPEEWLDDELRGWMHGYVQIASVTDLGALTWAVRSIQERMWVDALEATIEAHTMPAAMVREACGIPGTSVHTTWLCRDKPSMKQALREAGVPTAASIGADTSAQVQTFADTVGYPLILKPRSGAGAQDTVRIEDRAGLEKAISYFAGSGTTSIAVEEFVDGHEGFYDTISINGHVAADFATHYYPNVLEAMRSRWVAPQFVTTNRIDAVPDYAEVRQMGQRVIDALGIGTSATHMEWFASSKGLRFSEIGARPPGVGAWDLYSAANDMDLYREWASAVSYGHLETTPSRQYAAGIVALRPDRDGRITGYSGLDEMQARYGEYVLDAHLPAPGTPTQPVEAGYMANAYVRMRHHDYDAVRSMLDDVGRTVHVYAS